MTGALCVQERRRHVRNFFLIQLTQPMPDGPDPLDRAI
ncbi:Unknown protein sequence [Pseudomonas syringae pv. syringae]|nr:Unknown protein sequence [Pseudomonas syringae pv. syringae]